MGTTKAKAAPWEADPKVEELFKTYEEIEPARFTPCGLHHEHAHAIDALRVYALRKKAGLSREEVAARVCGERYASVVYEAREFGQRDAIFTPGDLRRIEQERMEPPFSLAAGLARALGVGLADIILCPVTRHGDGRKAPRRPIVPEALRVDVRSVGALVGDNGEPLALLGVEVKSPLSGIVRLEREDLPEAARSRMRWLRVPRRK